MRREELAESRLAVAMPARLREFLQESAKELGISEAAVCRMAIDRMSKADARHLSPDHEEGPY